jgi:four helix bundle protein
MKTHKDLDVWKNSIALVKDVYELTKSFPKEEVYGLTSQMRRAAVSIPTNIAEGAGRHYIKENIQFLYISQGSMSELETLLIISKELGYITEEKYYYFENKMNEIRSQLTGLIRFKEKQLAKDRETK